MNRSTTLRIITDIIIFAAIIQGWWFLALPLAIVGCWFFPYYVEIIVAGIVFDSLFGMVSGMGIYGYIGTISSIIISLAFLLVRKAIR